MRISSIILLWLSLAGTSACQRQELAPEELEAYVADPVNGYCQEQKVHGVQVRVTYQPTDLLALRSLTTRPLTKHSLDSTRAHYAKSAFFVMSLAREGHEVLQPKEGFSEYSQLLQTLAFQMTDHVRLITEQGDTLRPANYYLDRTYGAGNGSQLLFAFSPPAKTGTWHFRLSEFGLGTGNLDFAFPTERLQLAPTLRLP